MSSLRIEELLRKSLLGQELINTQFHLFSRRSRTTRRAVDCRVLCANNVLLTESAKYFLDLLSSDLDPSDPTLSNVAENDEILSGIPIDDYGYESDSDLDDDESVSNESSTVAPQRDNELSEGASESEDFDEAQSDTSDDTGSDAGAVVVDKEKSDAHTPETVTISDIAGTPTRSVSTAKGNSTRLQSIESRHILVKDTAFQTWYALLNYLYTGKVAFRSPKSLSGHSQASSLSTVEEPKCSAKSMYRLACKLGIDPLRDLAFASLRSSLTEHNILAELTRSLPIRYTPILEMELDILYKHVASPTIVIGLPSLVQRIANKEVPHGADIIIGFYARTLVAHYPGAPTVPVRLPKVRTESPKLLAAQPSNVLGTATQEPVNSPLPNDSNSAFWGFPDCTLAHATPVSLGGPGFPESFSKPLDSPKVAAPIVGMVDGEPRKSGGGKKKKKKK